MGKKPVLLLLAAALLCGLFGCGRTRYTRSYYDYFDTVSTVIGYAADADSFDGACAAVETVLADYHRLCDIYNEYEGMNNLKTVNDAAGVAPVAVDARLIDLVEYALDLGEQTGGAFNAAMGAVLTIWHEYRETALSGGPAAVPPAELLRAASAHCRAQDVVIDRAASTIYLADPDMSLDLGGVAKGWAAELAARALYARGDTAYVLSIGGNVRALDPKPGGDGWTAGVQNPDPAGEDAYLMTLQLSGCSLVTSGGYQRWYEAQGRRWHHIIDPVTLYPRDEFQSVSILTADSAYADGLSTAVFNMSGADGLAFIEGLEGVEACWIMADGSIVCSSGFTAQQRAQIKRPG